MVVLPTLNWLHNSMTTSLVKALLWSVMIFSGAPNMEMNPSQRHFVTVGAFWSFVTCAVIYVMPPGFEDDPTAVRTFDASGEEVGQL